MKKNHSTRRGVLAFEWILVVTVLMIGIIGGLAAFRAAMTLEILETATAIDEIKVDFIK